LATTYGLQKEADALRAKTHAFLSSKSTGTKNAQGGDVYDMNATEVEEFKAMNSDLEALESQLDALRKAEAFSMRKAEGRFQDVAPTTKSAGSPKSLAEMFFETKGIKDERLKVGMFAEIPDVDLKTTISTSAGFAPANNRTNIVVDSAQRTPRFGDYLPSVTTGLSVIKYMYESTFTNAAATVAEAGTKPESALAWTQGSVNVEKIATWVPVTDEQLDDVPAMMALINRRLLLMLMLEEEDQLLNGDGSTPNIRGFMNATGLQTQAKGADSAHDAVYKAFTKVRATGYAEPSLVVMHPNDWQSIRLTTTADGVYLWGSPSEDGVDRIWGKPVLVTTAQTEGSGLTGDFTMFSEVWRKQGIRLDISNSHSDYFVKNLQAIRIEERLALAIYRGAAFCEVTGI